MTICFSVNSEVKDKPALGIATFHIVIHLGALLREDMGIAIRQVRQYGRNTYLYLLDNRASDRQWAGRQALMRLFRTAYRTSSATEWRCSLTMSLAR